MLRAAFACVALVYWAGCNESNTATSDLGVTDGAVAPDAASLDGAQLDGGLYMSPVVLRGQYQLDGFTSDWFLVFHDSQSYFALDTAHVGATRIRIADYSPGASTDVRVVGRVAFLATTSDIGIAALHAWSSALAASAAVSLSTANAPLYWQASPDGKYLVYFDHFDGQMADLVLDTMDHTSPRVLAGGVGASSCGLSTTFVADSLVATYCPAGSSVQTLVTFNVTTGATKVLLPESRPFFAIDDQNTRVLAGNATFEAFVLPIGGGAATRVVDSDFDEGWFSADGSHVLYRTAFGHQLARVGIDGKGLEVLQPGKVSWIAGRSADGRWAVFLDPNDPMQPNDAFLASTEGPSKPILLSSNANTFVQGPAFTADSHFALIGAVPDFQTASTNMVTESVLGGAPLLLSTGSVRGWLAAVGSWIFVEQQMQTGGRQSTNLMSFVAAADPTVLTPIQAGIEPGVLLSPDKTQVWFSKSDGIYFAAIR